MPASSLISFVLDRVRDSMQVEARGDFHRLRCKAMSTPVNIVFAAASTVAEEFQKAVIDWIARFEARYSRFLSESIVGQINSRSSGDWIEVDDDADRLLSLCAEMHRLSNGVFDPARAGFSLGSPFPLPTGIRDMHIERGQVVIIQ